MKCFEACPESVHIITDDGHEILRENCTLCGKCADSCYAGALEITGTEMTVDEVFSRIEAEKSYYDKSGGGVTFSGGEPMMQVDFLLELLKRCKESGIHTAVDTAGCVPFKMFEKILPYTDLFLYDIKAGDSELHKELTAQPNELVFENLEKLSRAGKEIIVRYPCIKGANLDEAEEIAQKLEGIKINTVELLAYHKLGESKMKALGLEADIFEVPTREEMLEVKSIFENKGIPTVYKE